MKKRSEKFRDPFLEDIAHTRVAPARKGGLRSAWVHGVPKHGDKPLTFGSSCAFGDSEIAAPWAFATTASFDRSICDRVAISGNLSAQAHPFFM